MSAEIRPARTTSFPARTWFFRAVAALAVALVVLAAWVLLLDWPLRTGVIALGLLGALAAYGAVMKDSSSRPDAFL